MSDAAAMIDTAAPRTRTDDLATPGAQAPFPWIPLASRAVLFAAVQGVIAVGLGVAGLPAPVAASAAWWPVSATVTSVVSLVLLHRRARSLGQNPAVFIGVDGSAIGRDVALFLGEIVLAAPIAMAPNIGLAVALFGDYQAAIDLFIQPLPTAVALAVLVTFPITIALSELPTYYVDAMGRLEARGWSRWRALLVAAAFHAAQHATLPLIFDARFVIWRLFMFLPFAIYVGFLVQRRPSLLPWLMAFHALIDFAAVWPVWMLSR